VSDRELVPNTKTDLDRAKEKYAVIQSDPDVIDVINMEMIYAVDRVLPELIQDDKEMLEKLPSLDPVEIPPFAPWWSRIKKS
jgi:hypothetical protein